MRNLEFFVNALAAHTIAQLRNEMINNDVTNDWLPAHDYTRNDIVVMSCELQVTRSVAMGRSHSSVCQVM